MAKTLSIKIDGIKNAMRILKKKSNNTGKVIKESMIKIGAFMEGEIKSSIAGQRAEPTSVDTGAFLRSINFNANKDNVIIFTKIPYAGFLEFGTTRMKERRHFNNSKDRNKKEIKKIISKFIKKI